MLLHNLGCMVQVLEMHHEPPQDPMDMNPVREPRRCSPAALRGICRNMQEAKPPDDYHELMWLQPCVKAQLSSFANQCLFRMLCASFQQPLLDLHCPANPLASQESGRFQVLLEVLMWPAPAAVSAFTSNLRRCLDSKLSLPPSWKHIGPTKMPNSRPLRMFPMRAFKHVCSSDPPYEALQFLMCDAAIAAAALAPPTRKPNNHIYDIMPPELWNIVGENLATLDGTGLMGASVLAPAIHRFQLLSQDCAPFARRAWGQLSRECGVFIQHSSGLSSLLNQLNKPSVPSFHNLSTKLDLPNEARMRLIPRPKPILSKLQLLCNQPDLPCHQHLYLQIRLTLPWQASCYCCIPLLSCMPS